MKNFENERNRDVTNGQTLWRYIPARRFLEMIETSSIYLPTAAKYEKSDLNEGRFTDTYVRVVRNWVRQTELGPYMTEDEEIAIYLSKLLAAREASYISCWTVRDFEDRHMWDSFAEHGTGVALVTTLGKIDEEFYEYCDQNEPFDLSSGLITYDRANMHLHVSSQTIYNNHLPFFFLDGGQKSFDHEQEYRFVIYDPEEVEDIAAELLTDEAIEIKGTVKLSDDFRARNDAACGSGIEIPVQLDNFLLEVRFGPSMQPIVRDKIRDLLKEHRQSILCRSSELSDSV